MAAEFPDFKDVTAFNAFVKGLADEEIQGWKTADWNRMYEKLDEIVANDPSFEIRFQQHMQERADKGEIDAAKLAELNDGNDKDWVNIKNKLKRKFFTRSEGQEPLAKLYKNYRMEEKDLQNIVLTGKEIGTTLSDKRIDTQGQMPIDLASNNVININRDMMRQKTGELADEAVYHSTRYSKANYNPMTGKKREWLYDRVKSEVVLKSREEMGDSAGRCVEKDFYSSQIRLSSSSYSDDFLVTAVHEAVHAHAQMVRGIQVCEKMTGFLPRGDMSEGFFDLLQHNNDYYLSTNSSQTGQQLSQADMKSAFKSYQRQPMEKMAEVIGVCAEREFRDKTRQKSERTAKDLSLFVDRAVPESTFYNYQTGQAILAYRQESLGPSGENAKTMRAAYFSGLDDETYRKMNVSVSNGYVFILAPKGYDARSKISKALDKKLREDKVQQQSETSPALAAAMQNKLNSR